MNSTNSKRKSDAPENGSKKTKRASSKAPDAALQESGQQMAAVSDHLIVPQIEVYHRITIDDTVYKIVGKMAANVGVCIQETVIRAHMPIVKVLRQDGIEEAILSAITKKDGLINTIQFGKHQNGSTVAVFEPLEKSLAYHTTFGPLPINKVRAIAFQLIKALATLHVSDLVF